MELLAPCGNYESFLAVVNSKADAVYLAGSKYGARAYADNFSDEEIIKAIHHAHLLNIKVYLTVNTLIKEKEWNDVIDYITPFYEAGLDACIVQDIGLIYAFKNVFPKMECHVSTQSFITSINSVRFFRDLGVTRVVLARELSIEEIKTIKSECTKYNIEVETFIHGAMCYSYSGQCLFSSCLGGRSGNRGRCAGPCRLEYDATSSDGRKETGYLLSMKDQCVLDILPALIEAGVDSLKIEGRMKRPEYAAFVTKMYRKYIDLYKKSPKDYKVSKEDLLLLKSFYMRSEIGTGYYYERNGRDMISINNPAYSKTDEKLIERVKDEMLKARNLIPVSFYINCTVGEPLSVSANYNDIYVYDEAEVVTASINRPASKEDIIKHFSKLGDTVFKIDNIDIQLSPNAFLPVQAIKTLRRNIIEKLETEIIKNYNNTIKRESNPAKEFTIRKRNNIDFDTIIRVMTYEQLDAVLRYPEKNCIAIDCGLFINEKEKVKKILSATNFTAILDLPYVIRETEINLLYELINESSFLNGVIVNNIEELNILNETSYEGLIILGSGVYQWNNHSISILSCYYDSFIYPYELNNYEITDLEKNGFITVYGKTPLMQTSNCVEKTVSECHKNKGNRFIYIKDRKNYIMPVSRNCYNCTNSIFNAVPTSLHEECKMGKIKNNKVISFTNEDFAEVLLIMDIFINNENKIIKNYTKGYYKRGVE